MCRLLQNPLKINSNIFNFNFNFNFSLLLSSVEITGETKASHDNGYHGSILALERRTS